MMVPVITVIVLINILYMVCQVPDDYLAAWLVFV